MYTDPLPCKRAPVFRQTSQNSPSACTLTGVTQVLTMTWQRARPELELRTQPPSATMYALPAAPATLYRGSQLQKFTVLAAGAHASASAQAQGRGHNARTATASHQRLCLSRQLNRLCQQRCFTCFT